jgi:hypothetical protein
MSVTTADERKADETFEKAEHRLKKFFGGSSKYEEAAELFTKAANLYKMQKLSKSVNFLHFVSFPKS